MNKIVERWGGRSWLGPSLLVSLVLNLFLIGVLVGPMLFDRHPLRGARGYGPPSPFMSMLDRRSLPKDDRDAIRAIMVEQFPNIRPFFPKIGEARMALADALGSESYDAAQVRAAFANLDASFGGMTRMINESIVVGFEKLPADQRARIAQSMREKAQSRAAHGRDKDKGEASSPPPPPID
jgi:uncharacterized membrane protein